MARPTRIHKPHAESFDGLPLSLSEELSGLISVYGDYPGIASDLRALVADVEQRCPERAAELLQRRCPKRRAS